MPLVLTVDVLKQLWPKAIPGMIEGVSSASATVLAKYGIVTWRDLVDFVAECSEETGGMTRVVESGAYSAERAHEVWPGLFKTAADAAPFVVNDRLLFNKTYGAKLGNHPGTDDGYNFRGRGMIQLTGRDWYAKIGAETGLDLTGDPTLVAHPAHILECAAAYWKLAGVSALANAGNFLAEVRRINGGTTNMAARLQWRAKCEAVMTPEAIGAVAGPAPMPAVTPSPAPTVKDVQARLNALGAAPQLKVDGNAGPSTCGAILKAIERATA